MSELTFVVEPGIGPWLFPRRGSRADLVLALPYVVYDEIPPRPALDDVLARGRLDAGMSGGCIWKPFRLEKPAYRELVDELQRRGTLTVHGRDPGGKPFKLPEDPEFVPPTIGVSGDHRYRLRFKPERKQGDQSERIPDEPSGDPYERWLDDLPVGRLYLGCLEAIDSDWEDHPDDAFELPGELVAKLRLLAGSYREWDRRRARTTRAPRRGVSAIADEAKGINHDIKNCIDRLELPRWPFDRFEVSGL